MKRFTKRWELGSEFHWMGPAPAPCVGWPDHASWYLLGRHAPIALLGALPRRPRRLWIPAYFCPDVAQYWARHLPVVRYADDPRRAEPEWSTLRPERDDLVVAVNYFGVRHGEPWGHWRERNECVLVEDHTHDPVSGWAMRSTADYVFSSLRKTMPVPDGAIFWSPRGLPLPEAAADEQAGSALKMAAMAWKLEYLNGRVPADGKAGFLQMQQAGEEAFERIENTADITQFSRHYLFGGVPVRWRRRRAANVNRLLHSLEGWPEAKPLFKSWPKDSAPYALVLEFPSQAARDRARRRFKENEIFCPIHWSQPGDGEPEMQALAATLLTIPTDQRYAAADMDRVADAAIGSALSRHAKL